MSQSNEKLIVLVEDDELSAVSLKLYLETVSYTHLTLPTIYSV